MSGASDHSGERILDALQERAKELDCLYRVEEILGHEEQSLCEVLQKVVQAIPPGWQHPSECTAKISLGCSTVASPDFHETSHVLSAPILVQGTRVGTLSVYYTREMPPADEGPFLRGERRLIDTIAERLGEVCARRKGKEDSRGWRSAIQSLPAHETTEWWVILGFLRRTDQSLLMRISRKMINYLCWNGVPGARELLQKFSQPEDHVLGENRPGRRRRVKESFSLADEAFELAAIHLSDGEFVSCIQKWIKEDRSSFLFTALESHDTSLADIVDALERYKESGVDEADLSLATQKLLRVSLTRRFLTDQIDYVGVAKEYLAATDFFDLVQRIIIPPDSHGRLGGKSAGLFLASRIVQRSSEYADILSGIKVPKTWYITSDGLMNFVRHNSLEEVYNRKYRDIDQVRQEYPYLIQIFKSSHFPPEIAKGLSVALDDFEDRPLIVRSSSLLEDRSGAAFSGKYKSLFLANRGSKKERLAALMDAVAEVYASVFSPDPIEYRAERSLLDFNEEMGIMIQEVVGTRVGDFFLPAFAGVAFSNNEFRWSPRIKREDGLLRMVPGLGTRAVDRLSDDYPVLIAPGQPGLRVNPTVEETVRYAPKKVDAVNLATGAFESIEIGDLVRRHGAEYPRIHQLVSISDGDRIRRPLGPNIDFERDELVFTFEGLIEGTPFITRIRTLLKVLREKIGSPVDIEFASDGENLYLLQCRPQNPSRGMVASPIPRDIPPDQIIFSANRHVSNGRVPEITHVVYVDPDRYGEVPDFATLKEVGRAVGRLNKVLPKRRFILMGPGRWGSRGDLNLGVDVTYSDINNTAVLIEIARKKKNYLPDLSFGTHFFQDLVEASIRYLPLYPDDPGTHFQEPFLARSPNVLADVAPEFAHLGDTVRVIDVPGTTGGRILRVLMNADLDQALGFLAPPSGAADEAVGPSECPEQAPEDHSRWRLRMAQQLAAQLDGERFGVKGIYIFGSAKNAAAGPASDIDLIIHFAGSEEQREAIDLWLDGFSLCLGEVNYLRTGVRKDRLLDVHFVTDEDVARRAGYAARIGALTDAARPLELKARG